jgi:hypothetical protein
LEREVASGIGEQGITVMGVDILPTELPRDSSVHFGQAVEGIVQELVAARREHLQQSSGVDPKLLSRRLVSIDG